MLLSQRLNQLIKRCCIVIIVLVFIIIITDEINEEVVGVVINR